MTSSDLFLTPPPCPHAAGLSQAFTRRPTPPQIVFKSCFFVHNEEKAHNIGYAGGHSPSIADNLEAATRTKPANKRFGVATHSKGFSNANIYRLGVEKCNYENSSERFMKCPFGCVCYGEQKCRQSHWPQRKLTCS